MAASGATTLGQLATMTAQIEANLKASEDRMDELGGATPPRGHSRRLARCCDGRPGRRE